LVTKSVIKEDTHYDLKEGGYGGFDHLNQKEMSVRGNKKLTELFKDDEWKELFNNAVKNGIDEYIKSGGSMMGFKGKTHSDETKQKMSETMKKVSQGEKNSQFGSMWIHNLQLKVSKKIKKEELPTWEQDGWLKGRKMKFI